MEDEKVSLDLEDDSEDEGIARTSEDVRREDIDTLTAEEEAEQLLRGGGGGNTARPDRPRRKPRWRREGSLGVNREVMYDTEEGDAQSGGSEESSDVDEKDMNRKPAPKKWFGRYVAGSITILVVTLGFLSLLHGAWKASRKSGKQHGDAGGVNGGQDAWPEISYQPQTLSNGTHTFAPTTLLISLDGFRADYLQRHITPLLTSFAESGVSPPYMLPSFPSLTFPNHFTLVTGLHPESHGIVGNTFWDPDLQKGFHYTDPHRSMQDYWWRAEPLWVTAEKQGVRTAIHMWPGSEVQGGIGGVEASDVDGYNRQELLSKKVDKVLGWLDREAETRPQFVAAYVPNVDSDGHKFGPNSTYIRSTIAEVDGMLGALLKGLQERNLMDVVNIVVVSDHGMATTSTNRLVQLEDLIDTSLIEHTDGWPLYGLRPYNTTPSNVKKIYDTLLANAKHHTDKIDVYLRDELPERYHFRQNDRIAPIWIVPQPGWAIVTLDEFDVAAGIHGGLTYHPRGLHGYDNEHPLMRAIFIARGPAFRHQPGSRLEPFRNTEVYNIICDSLGIEPVANNGTLRLPLRPEGGHDFDQLKDVPEDLQDDPDLALPPPPAAGTGTVPNLASPHAGEFSILPVMPETVAPNQANRPEFMVPTEGIPPVPTQTDERTKPEQMGQPNKPVDEERPAPTRPVVHDGLDEEDEGDINRWWQWVQGKLDAIKGWAVDTFGRKGIEAEGKEKQAEP